VTDAEALQDQEAKGWSFVMLLVSVLAFLSKSVLSYQQSKERYHSLVTSSLYEKVPHLLAAGALRSYVRSFMCSREYVRRTWTATVACSST